MIEQMTGIDKHVGLRRPLGNIYYYCKRRSYPFLNLLAINQDEGKPGAKIFDGLDLYKEHSRIFVFNWLSNPVPSVRDFEDARAWHEGRAA